MWLKIKHFLGKLIGVVEAETCLKNGCEDYCGMSPSQAIIFHMKARR